MLGDIDEEEEKEKKKKEKPSAFEKQLAKLNKTQTMLLNKMLMKEKEQQGEGKAVVDQHEVDYATIPDPKVEKTKEQEKPKEAEKPKEVEKLKK